MDGYPDRLLDEYHAQISDGFRELMARYTTAELRQLCGRLAGRQQLTAGQAVALRMARVEIARRVGLTLAAYADLAE